MVLEILSLGPGGPTVEPLLSVIGGGPMVDFKWRKDDMATWDAKTVVRPK